MMGNMQDHGADVESTAFDAAWDNGEPVQADAQGVVFTATPPGGARFVQASLTFAVATRVATGRPSFGVHRSELTPA